MNTAGLVSTQQYWSRSSKNIQFGKGHIKPFTDFRRITRGKHKGKFLVVINGGKAKQIIVREEAIMRFPGEEE